MPVAEAVQTFTGIANENEFFSHNYLAEVFKGDIRELIDAWLKAEEASPADESARSPVKRLQGTAGRWFAQQSQTARSKSAQEALEAHFARHRPLLAALGYAPNPDGQAELHSGFPVPAWQVCGDAGKPPQLLVMPAYTPGQEEEDPFEQKLASCHYRGIPVPKKLADLTLA